MYSYHHVYHPLSPSTDGPVGDWMNRVRQVGVSTWEEPYLRPITREEASSLAVWATLILGKISELKLVGATLH